MALDLTTRDTAAAAAATAARAELIKAVRTRDETRAQADAAAAELAELIVQVRDGKVLPPAEIMELARISHAGLYRVRA